MAGKGSAPVEDAPATVEDAAAAQRAAALAHVLAMPRGTGYQAQLARLFGLKRGMTLRNWTRSQRHKYVSQGDVLDNEDVTAIFDRFFGSSPEDAPIRKIGAVVEDAPAS